MPLIGHNLETGQYDRVRKSTNLGFSLIMGFAVVATALGFFAPNALAVINSKNAATTAFLIQISFLTFIPMSMQLAQIN